ncbi:Ubiquinone biosynthesis protein [Tumidithrix helvetica PCC 7403]|uniref:Coq4 family protein n=1 Tax=Tumidithrix helvetica TaxID=3457545 RepID=UPI003C94D046
MNTKDGLKQTWQDSVLDSIIAMARGDDGDFVLLDRIAKTTSEPQGLQKVIDWLSQTPQGKAAFEKRPRVGTIDLQHLSQLPPDTLGYAYAQHFMDNHLKLMTPHSANNDFEFLGAHLGETHDIWHVVTGCNTMILGEIQLEAFYVGQLSASRFWLALLVKNLLKATIGDIEVSGQYMDAIAKGWLMAKQAKPLFGIEWNQLWEKPLEEVRDSLNVVSIDI